MTRWGDDCPSDLVLDRHLLGELEESTERERVTGHIGECQACTQRVAEMERVAAAFPHEAPALRPPRAASSGRRVMAAASGLTLLAASVIAVLWVGGGTPASERSKGGSQFTVYVKRASGAVEALESGGAAASGEAVRFELRTSQQTWAVVLGVDSSKVITAYAPASGPALRLEPGAKTVPEGSIVLDDTPGVEVFVSLFCSAPLTVEEAHRDARVALERAGGDPLQLGALRSSCGQQTVVIRKAKK